MLPIYRVHLSEDERSRLSHMISSGKSAASVLTLARILLKADTTKSWERQRNANQTKVDWRFTTADARIKLKRLYPKYV